MNVIVVPKQGRQEANVELKAAWKEDGLFSAHHVCEASFDITVVRRVARDEAGAAATGEGRWREGAGLRGEAEIVVAAKTQHFAAVELVAQAGAGLDRGHLAVEAVGPGCVEPSPEAAVMRRGHVRR